MNVARALAALALVLTASRAAAAPTFSLGAGYAWLAHDGERGRLSADGVAIEGRIEGRFAPRVGVGLALTWGLTDWDRAGEWIEAGNRAGTWTTDRFADVEAWATKEDAKKDTRGLRYVGAAFADMFLAMTYAAVPFCYVGSVGGATGHLQVDATATFHLTDVASGAPAPDAWLEVGGGAATIPFRGIDWRGAAGPVLGVGARYGAFRLGARLLWSPGVLNELPSGGAVAIGALTLGVSSR